MAIAPVQTFDFYDMSTFEYVETFRFAFATDGSLFTGWPYLQIVAACTVSANGFYEDGSSIVRLYRDGTPFSMDGTLIASQTYNGGGSLAQPIVLRPKIATPTGRVFFTISTEGGGRLGHSWNPTIGRFVVLVMGSN